MTPLIDRIRAYVAAIPTCACHACGARYIAEEIGACPSCLASRYQFWIRRDTAADALLREVAALEPVGSMQLSGLIDDFVVPVVPGDIPTGTALYALTGDSQ